MTDERLGHAAGAWLRDTDEPARDPQGIVRAAMTRVPQIRQVHASGLRARLEREAVPVPVVGRAATDHHVRKGGSSMYASLRFVMAAVVLLATGGLLFAVMWPPSTDRAVAPVPATSFASPQPTATSAPSESPTLTTTDTTSDGTFELTVSSPRSTWTVDEPIDVSATFTYVGDRSRSTVRATGGGPVGFWFEQLDGPLTNADRLVGDTSCGSHTYVRGEPEVVPFRKDGGYDPGSDDPAEVFWRTWLNDPELHLPIGTYRISAGASYGASDCGENPLAVAITIEVEDAPEPTAAASDSAPDTADEWGPLAVLRGAAGGFGGDAAIGPGMVTIGDRCVTIQADRADRPVTLVWPDDSTEWRATDRRIVFMDRGGDRVRLDDGDRVMLGGVVLWPPDSGTPEPGARWSAGLDDGWVAEPDPTCPEALWLVGEVDERSAATSSGARQRSPSSRDLDEAQAFRQGFALPSSMAVVRDSFVDRETYSDMSHGVPLTPDEDAELDRRRGIVWKSGPARDFARTLDGYADVYIDHQRGGIPVFRFTDDLEAKRAAIAEVMPDGIGFDVQQAEYTIKQLRQKQDRITQDMLKTDWLLDGDIQLVSAGASVTANRVLVGVLEEADMARAREILQERYGPMVDVEYIGPSEED